MSKPFLIAIDEGTTNAKAITVDSDGYIGAKGSVPVSLNHPQPGWAEQDPWQIWQATESAITQCLDKSDIANLKGIGVSNQRESVLVWERKTGLPLTPIISWQCRRSESLCQAIACKPEAARVIQLTGLALDPLFPAAKIAWLLDSIPDGQDRAQRGDLCVGTVDVWLVWNLTKGEAFVTDHSNASRYQLFNIHTLAWDDELLRIFNIPRACLPRVLPSSELRGYTRHCKALPDGIPILSQIGDSHAALYGQGGFNPGTVKATYGTGSSLMTRIDHVPVRDFGLSSTIAWHDGAMNLALEGNITHTGAGLAFVSRILGIHDFDQLSQMAQSTATNAGVYFVPALSGLGAPYWDTQVRGMFCGLTDATTPAIMARAGIESIAYQIADVFHAMESASDQRLDALLVDGGATKNSWLMQFQADLLQRTIVRNKVAEISAVGAGYLAGKAIGWWNSHRQLSALPRDVEFIEPKIQTSEMIENYRQWKAAVARARFNSNTSEER
jgi:glycerol kinase